VLYSGYRLDPESGLYQVRYRQYHPTLGRWVQRDPLGYDDGMNLYEYVKSGPFAYTDPYGLCCCLIIVLQYDPNSLLGRGQPAPAPLKGTAGNADFKASAEKLKIDKKYNEQCKAQEIVTRDLDNVDVMDLKTTIESVKDECKDGIKRITIIGHGNPITGVSWPKGKGKNPVPVGVGTLSEAFKSDVKKGEFLLDIDLYACYSWHTASQFVNKVFPKTVTISGNKEFVIVNDGKKAIAPKSEIEGNEKKFKTGTVTGDSKK
jgi:RHS repeat-associated protein